MITKKTALITGASSGIGAAFARKLAAMDYNLILVGRRMNLLEKICNELQKQHKISAEFMVVELSNKEEIALIENKIRETPNLEILINNAGFGINQDFNNSDLEKQIEMITVHNIVTVRLTYSALQPMIKNKKGFIINVSSIAALLLSPKNNLYCATKAFINSFTESLHLELHGKNIRVQALCPGFTFTDFHQKMGYDPSDPMFKYFMSAKYVVDYSIKDLECNKIISVPGFRYKLARLIPFLPRKLFYKIVLKNSKY